MVKYNSIITYTYRAYSGGSCPCGITGSIPASNCCCSKVGYGWIQLVHSIVIIVSRWKCDAAVLYAMEEYCIVFRDEKETLYTKE